MCEHRLWNEPEGLLCDNDSPEPHGHTYTAAWAPDRHDATETAA